MAEFMEDQTEHLKKANHELEISKMQHMDRMAVLEKENKRLRKKFNEIDFQQKQQRDDYELRITQYNNQIQELEATREALEKSITEKDQMAEKVRETNEAAMKEEKKIQDKRFTELERKMMDLESDCTDINEFKSQKEEYLRKIAMLEQKLEDEVKIKNNSINEKEREKIQATEKLRKEMLYKIKETKANLLALNDEQLQTTTRLTILQNHQLTTELEYQSKQTEQLLYKNSKMKTQIDTMKRDIQIHKEVEKELAKRSHFCQKVIKRLKQQVKDLQSEKTENRPHIMGGQTQRKSNGGNANMVANNKANEDLINFLEHKLEEIEKKLQRTQSEYELLQSDYVELQDKMNMSREKYKRAALLMTEFLDDILNQTPNILESDKDMHLNLEKM